MDHIATLLLDHPSLHLHHMHCPHPGDDERMQGDGNITEDGSGHNIRLLSILTDWLSARYAQQQQWGSFTSGFCPKCCPFVGVCWNVNNGKWSFQAVMEEISQAV